VPGLLYCFIELGQISGMVRPITGTVHPRGKRAVEPSATRKLCEGTDLTEHQNRHRARLIFL
jgi:hypothetical protein